MIEPPNTELPAELPLTIVQGSLITLPDSFQPQWFQPVTVSAVRDLPNPGPNFHDIFVVATQTCDIVAPIEVEPFVEMIACIEDQDGHYRAFPKNSTRWTEVPETQLVALSAYRIMVPKRQLHRQTARPWPGNRESLTDFRIWLSKRQGRQANSTEIENIIIRPLKSVMSKISETKYGEEFNGIVREMRLGPIAQVEPPYDVKILVLLKDIPALTPSQDQALNKALIRIEDKLVACEGISTITMLRTSARRLSLHEYDISIYLDFDAISSESAQAADSLHSHLG